MVKYWGMSKKGRLQFNSQKFGKNILFILIATLLVVAFIGVSFFIYKDSTPPYLPDGDVGDNDSLATGLIINEYMSSNGGVFADSNGKCHDWLELYNGGSSPLNLKNFGLTKRANETQWFFPEVIIPAKGYLVVFMGGSGSDGLHANFKLKSSGGEGLLLKNPSGKVIDAITTVPIKKNWVAARDADGSWFSTQSATPGFANTKAGKEAFIASLTKENDTGLVINEFLPKNKGNFSIDGFYPGFIEVKNSGKSVIELSEFSLSGDINAPFRWKFPNKLLAPGQVAVVYTANINLNTEPFFVDWSLNNNIGDCLLSHKNKIIQRISYDGLPNGVAYCLSGNAYHNNAVVSPGYDNDTKGVEAFAANYQKAKTQLIINEAMSSNYQYLPHNGNSYYDWLELYNNGLQPLDLSEYCLTTNQNQPDLYRLPKVVLQPGEYFVLMCSGDVGLSGGTYTHTNFKIGTYEGVYLYKAGVCIDSMFVGDLPLGHSYGRSSNGGFVYMSKPTPNAANNEGVREIATAPQGDIASGVYNDIASLLVSFSAPGTIFYTTNGSDPTSSSHRYEGSMDLKKTTVLKLVNIEEGKRVSPVVTYSYIINENHTLPVLSLVLDQGQFSRMRNNRSGKTEVPTTAQFFDEDGGFAIDCGIRLFGGQTRFMSKQSFQLEFRKRYGATALNYKLFPHRDFASFNEVVLRSSSQDSLYAMIRDTLAASLNLEYGGQCLVQDYRYCIIYINGSYYGIYNFREKVNAGYVANNFNVPPAGSNVIRNGGKVTTGSREPLKAVKQYVANHNMRSPQVYDEVAKMLDMVSFADFWVGSLYTTNNDLVNYRFVNHPAYNNGRLYTVFYDQDWAFYNGHRDYLAKDIVATQYYDGSDAILSHGLFKNPQFQELFLERLAYGLNNQWKKENVMAELERQYELLKPEMRRERQRWIGTYNGWENEIQFLRDYVRKRQSVLLRHVKRYFNLSNERMKEIFGDLS